MASSIHPLIARSTKDSSQSQQCNSPQSDSPRRNIARRRSATARFATARRSARRGFTLVEMLVTVAVTLVLILALVSVFEWIGERVAIGRAGIELAGTVRGAALRLQNDLDGLTVPVRPWPTSESGLGYFEYIERVEDDDTGRQLVPPLSLQGDRDDILAFTARSTTEPFSGQVMYYDAIANTVKSTIATSNQAEIVWWAQNDDIDGNFQFTPDEQVSLIVHRRVLMIRPELNNVATGSWVDLPQFFNPAKTTYDVSQLADRKTLANDLRKFYNGNDVSFRLTKIQAGNNVTVRIIANSLADLGRRENRWLRQPMVIMNPDSNNPAMAPWPPVFPNPIDLNPLSFTSLGWMPCFGNRLGEDVILSNALAFDVRAFDPTVPVSGKTGIALLPGDPGWLPTDVWDPMTQSYTANVISFSGYVDLFYSRKWLSMMPSQWPNGLQSTFSGAPHSRSQISLPNYNPSYDTWSYTYEHDGIDQNNDMVTDAATNGLDDDGTNGTDDVGERDTAPPYPVALRGIQVRLRIYESGTRQPRQATVTADFVPE